MKSTKKTKTEAPILKIQHLTKYYGKNCAVKDLSLELQKGEAFGFIGPNGAGKSTTIRSIMNLVNKTGGQVFIENENFTKDNVKLKKEIGYLPSEIHLYDDLIVGQMLDYHASFYQDDLSAKRKKLVKLLGLDETKKIEDLSLGNTKKLGIVLAFMSSPKLLILDEPTSGLDPIMQQVFYNLLQMEKQKGTTIFYSTHILSEVPKICDRVGIIKDGVLLKIETINELRAKSLTNVTIESPDIDKIIHTLKLTNYDRSDSQIIFKNHLSPNALIEQLSKFNLTKILIEEATLEDVFLHYYK